MLGINLEICKNADTLAARAAEMVTAAARAAIQQRGKFTLVLSGGSTPEKLYALLAQPERSAAIDWLNVSLFFGDERFVSAEDPASNFGMARRSLLGGINVPTAQVFAMPTDEESPAKVAAAYSRELGRAFGQTPDSAPPPRFDLVLLGLGDDGHTASLFEGKDSLHVTDKWVTWSSPGVLPPLVDRITLTYPVLNATREVVFLVAGQKKADVLQEVLEGVPGFDQYPAAGVRPTEGTLTWLVDESAASRLRRRHSRVLE